MLIYFTRFTSNKQTKKKCAIYFPFLSGPQVFDPMKIPVDMIFHILGYISLNLYTLFLFFQFSFFLLSSLVQKTNGSMDAFSN